MTDVTEGMARAIFEAGSVLGGRPIPAWDAQAEITQIAYRRAAQAALDYLKQPQPASKPLPEGQGPEMTTEQVEAMNRFKAVWQPLADVLRGDAP